MKFSALCAGLGDVLCAIPLGDFPGDIFLTSQAIDTGLCTKHTHIAVAQNKQRLELNPKTECILQL